MQASELPDYSPDPTLTPDQHYILALLAEGNSITQAADAVGIHRNAVRNWRRSVPAFAREMEFAVREQALVWHEQATQLAPIAAVELEKLLTSPETPPAVRLRAALVILKIAPEPKIQPLRAIVHTTVDLETTHGQILAFKKEIQRVQPPQIENDAQSCTTETIRRPPEPGRNSTCPCGSGQKYKRCCGSGTHLQAAA